MTSEAFTRTARAKAVVKRWLASEPPSVEQLRAARAGMGHQNFDEALRVYDRERQAQQEAERRASWTNVELPFDEPSGRGVG